MYQDKVEKAPFSARMLILLVTNQGCPTFGTNVGQGVFHWKISGLEFATEIFQLTALPTCLKGSVVDQHIPSSHFAHWKWLCLQYYAHFAPTFWTILTTDPPWWPSPAGGAVHEQRSAPPSEASRHQMGIPSHGWMVKRSEAGEVVRWHFHNCRVQRRLECNCKISF